MTASTYFTLSCDTYKHTIFSGFTRLQEQQEFVDLTLAADGHLVKVHKNIMALASPYIKELVKMTSGDNPVIYLHNVNHDLLKYLLEYIYQGEVNIPQDSLESFLQLSQSLHITGMNKTNTSKKPIKQTILPEQNLGTSSKQQIGERCPTSTLDLANVGTCKDKNSKVQTSAKIENPRSKASLAQLSYLAEHMRRHPMMASGLGQSLQGRASIESSWVELAEHLNCIGGSKKPVLKWKQTWRDLRCSVKKKASLNNREFQGYSPGSTGNGPPMLKELTQEEEQELEMMCPETVYGMEDNIATEPMLQNDTPGPSGYQAPACLTPPAPDSYDIAGPFSALPDQEPHPPSAPPKTPKKRKRDAPKNDNFDIKLLEIEEEKLKIKREHNAIDTNEISL